MTSNTSPAGAYMCKCGDAHPLNSACPDAASIERDDAGRDVVQLWREHYDDIPDVLPARLHDALDRLAAAHGFATVQSD